MKTAAECAGRI